MKILHINGYFKEDVVYQENLLTIGQKELGHEIILLTSRYELDMKINNGKRKHPAGETSYNGIKVIRVDDYIELKKNALVLFKNVYKYLKANRPDIIFFHDVSFNLFYGVFYKMFNTKVILHVDFHSDEYNALNSFLGPIYHFFWRIFFKIFRNKFDRYFGVAPESVSFVNKFYKIPLSKITLLPLPGDASLINKKDEIRHDYRKKIGLNDNHKILVHSGKLPQGKETKLVLEAFSNLSNENFRLLVIGSIENSFLPIFNQFLKNDSRIIFLGWLKPNEVRNFLYASDLMIQPGSLSHTFIEAICSGLPLILNNTPQGEYLTQKGNGVLLKIKNPDVLSALILESLLENKYNQMRESAIASALYYHYTNIAKISLT